MIITIFSVSAKMPLRSKLKKHIVPWQSSTIRTRTRMIHVRNRFSRKSSKLTMFCWTLVTGLSTSSSAIPWLLLISLRGKRGDLILYAPCSMPPAIYSRGFSATRINAELFGDTTTKLQLASPLKTPHKEKKPRFFIGSFKPAIPVREAELWPEHARWPAPDAKDVERSRK